MKLGIVGAMAVEVESLTAQLSHPVVTKKAGMTFCQGELAGLPVVVVQCGVGKVHAAMCIQVLCDCFAVTHVVNTGVAGSLSAALDIGDLVISRDAMYHDFDVAPLGYALGQVPGMDVLQFPADDTLMAQAFAAAEKVNPGHTHIGRIASGDQFVCDGAQKANIVANTQAMCTEMEGAAIAHTAWRNGVPFVIIRAISDKADNSAQMDYPTFEAMAARHCAGVVVQLCHALAETEL